MTTLNLQVGQSSDDAREAAAGTVNISEVTSGLATTGAWYGARFTGAGAVLPGSTINTATCQLYANGTANDDPAFDIYCEDSDSPGTFAATDFNISGRARTATPVNWTATNIGAGFGTSPSIVTPVQDAVNRAGFGGVIALIFDCVTGVNFTVRNYDTASTDAPKLDIDYTVSGVPKLDEGMLAGGLQPLGGGLG